MRDPAPSPLSPSDLLYGIRIIEPTMPVTVAGFVDDVRPTRGPHAYLTLSGDGVAIDARVPIGQAPAPKTTVRMTGTVHLKVDNFKRGLVIELHGHIDGVAERPMDGPADRPRIEIHKPRRVMLDALFADWQVHPDDLVVIGTGRAYGDLTGRFATKRRPVHREVSMTNPDAIVGAAIAAAASGAKGVIYARGGSDATEALWDDPEFVARLVAVDVPFYTAIGHSDRMHLADMYSDQPFMTPTDFGMTLLSIEQSRAREGREKRRLHAEIDRLNGELASTKAVSPLILERGRPTWAPSLTPQAWALLAVIVVLAIAIAPWFRR